MEGLGRGGREMGGSGRKGKGWEISTHILKYLLKNFNY